MILNVLLHCCEKSNTCEEQRCRELTESLGWGEGIWGEGKRKITFLSYCCRCHCFSSISFAQAAAAALWLGSLRADPCVLVSPSHPLHTCILGAMLCLLWHTFSRGMESNFLFVPLTRYSADTLFGMAWPYYLAPMAGKGSAGLSLP